MTSILLQKIYINRVIEALYFEFLNYIRLECRFIELPFLYAYTFDYTRQ
jgi:hypothetical protein